MPVSSYAGYPDVSRPAAPAVLFKAQPAFKKHSLTALNDSQALAASQAA
jgi:hypothetical protein